MSRLLGKDGRFQNNTAVSTSSDLKISMDNLMNNNTEQRFTQEDCKFIRKVLKNKFSSDMALLKTLESPSGRQFVLAARELHEAIEKSGASLPISSYLYYFILVSHTLRASGISVYEITDSLSENIAKVSQDLKEKYTTYFNRWEKHVPLTLFVGIREENGVRRFQIIGDLDKACVVLEGTAPLPETPSSSENWEE